ncbi:E3 ubiquitin-protein ligase RNF139-like [Brienomyrus brachyistius]|uniref:E3 ubiquitin-protein ligase RNF139-like n=1 Tax=Brienomyrus brachyistius TaxID=42636 RepID=UPI0020B445EE|nr:E3 ubiquitin-protein ligase RNF139-like [Brienomyrus brachyistius]
MASPPARIGQQALAVVDVTFRVPCIFIIDAIFNSSHTEADLGSGWFEAVGRILIRVLGVLLSSMVLVLSQRALFRFYALFLAVLLGAMAVWLNCYVAWHANPYGRYDAFGLHVFPSDRPTLWLGVATVQLALGAGYVMLLGLRPALAAFVVLAAVLPIGTLAVGLPPEARQLVAAASGLVLVVNILAYLTLKVKWFCFSCRYIYLLLRHLHRVYGVQMLLEDTWKRIRFPDVLRVFWLTRMTAQAVILLYVVGATGNRDGSQSYLTGDVFWDLFSNLIISGCDSTLTVLGMSAVISSIAHYLGLGILAFIGSTEEEDKRLGFVAPVLFFILALQTGLSGLNPEERLVRLSRNLCLLLTAILHFIHGMTDPVLMSLSASHVSSFRRHFPVLLVSLLLFVLPVVLSYALWQLYALNTWLFAVTAFCVELCLKVAVSLTVYVLFMVDGYYGVLWEKLDDYVYCVRSAGNIIEFMFGVIMFGNGAYTMVFESGSKIRACMMCLHAYFNIYLQAKNGWKTFINRRTAVKKINSLPEVKGSQLRNIEDVCAICYQEFSSSARLTPCRHYFHTLCLRKWLYIQDTCPMCHQRVYIEEDVQDSSVFSNNNGYVAPNEDAVEPAAAGGVDPVATDLEDEFLEDNDSIEYDEEEWDMQNRGIPIEEDYVDDETDSSGE